MSRWTVHRCHEVFDAHASKSAIIIERKKCPDYLKGMKEMKMEAQNYTNSWIMRDNNSDDTSILSGERATQSPSIHALCTLNSICGIDYLFIYSSIFEIETHPKCKSATRVIEREWNRTCASQRVQRQSFKVIVRRFSTCLFFLRFHFFFFLWQNVIREEQRTEWTLSTMRVYGFPCHVTIHLAHLTKSKT